MTGVCELSAELIVCLTVLSRRCGRRRSHLNIAGRWCRLPAEYKLAPWMAVIGAFGSSIPWLLP